MTSLGVIIAKDLKLLLRDRTALLFLTLAPIVVIAVAGFSLANLYGADPAGLTAYEKKGFDPHAPGYKDAMHGSCLECHRLREQEKGEDPAIATSRGNCLFCHRDWADPAMLEALEVAEALER